MITCPECGHTAPEEVKFCDRCGQALTATSSSPRVTLKPLEVGTELKGGYKIVELLGQSSEENRYRANRQSGDKTEYFQLRERSGPAAPLPEQSAEAKPAAPQAEPPPAEDPNGPRARTRELQMPDAQRPAESSANPAGVEASTDEAIVTLTDAIEETDAAHDAAAEPQAAEPQGPESGQTETSATGRQNGAPETDAAIPEESAGAPSADLGELFGRVMGLSLTLKHPAFQRALEGFADDGRVYLVYPDERLVPLSRRPGGIKMSEAEALNVAIQTCQAIAFINKRALRLNDICPDSLAYDAGGRIKIISLDYVSNDNELQSEPILNDGYTAPEIYRGKAVDKRADIFSVGCLLYSCLTGDRIASESWREEASPIRFYPPHVVSPAMERAVRRALAFQPAERWATADAFKAELLRLSARINVRSGALTDVGIVRQLNEDSVMVLEYARDSQIEPAEHFLYVVSDGMGGAEAGETASALAVAAIRDHVEKAFSVEPKTVSPTLLQDALEEANRRVQEHQASHPETRGMGATGVAALIVPPELWVAWVGDSRAYLYDGSALRQLTKDHSLVQRLVEIGQITPEEARYHEHKNVITRSLGARQSGPAGAESLNLRLKRGDRLMLCSDGLMAHVDDQRLEQILRRHADPLEAARECVVAANAGGGTDNTSVIVVFAD
jgi:serine/threonine protein phosphatase PrpC